MAKRKKWSAASKFEIALQMLKGEQTLNDICKRYEVAPTQVKAWKKQLVEQGTEIFSKAALKADTAKEAEHEQGKLYEKIGQLTMERDFLKKVLGKFHGDDDRS
jgi:transposase